MPPCAFKHSKYFLLLSFTLTRCWQRQPRKVLICSKTVVWYLVFCSSRDSGQNLQPLSIITEINIAFAKGTLSDM